MYGEVQVGKDQEKAQSEKDSHSKNRGGKKTKLTIRYLYHETIVSRMGSYLDFLGPPHGTTPAAVIANKNNC